MPTPFPTQISGAAFLADRARALLADEPRVGKTGAAIIAADLTLSETILVITTSSGRPVWRRAFADWSPFGRKVQVLDGKKPLANDSQVAVVGWGSIANPQIRSQLLRRKWGVVIPDECHLAKSFDAKRTQALFGELTEGGKWLDNKQALAGGQDHIWPLTGTPAPNSPADLYPMLRALRPDCLRAHDGMPDVLVEEDFLKRYTIRKPKKIGPWRTIMVVIGGRNEAELKHRMDGFMLRRTQKDVGITEPIYETFPLAVSDRMKREAEADLDKTALLAAAEAGETKSLEMHLGPLRRLTGEIKARAVVEAIRDEFECGLRKIVLAYWHKDVGQILKEGLAQYGVVGIDGSTPADTRGEAEQRFLRDPSIRVFLGQIQAAGEAIDLSSASELLFVETSFQPAQMAQMSKRITNFTQAGQPRVRVAVLEGSLDEALQTILLRKWSSIREVIS